jgi:large subunit ribosomal protein L32e
MRKEKGGWPRRVRIGYGTTSLSKGLHPRGLSERLVGKLSDLEGLDPKLHIVRFSARLGERKRLLFLEKAKEFGLRVANPGKVEITRPEEGKEEETTVPVIEKAMEEKETADASTESASEEESAT